MKNIIQIIKISKPLHKLVIFISFLILLSSVLDLVVPFASKFIVDEISNQLTNQTGDLSRLYFFIGLGFVLSLLSIIITALSNRLGDHFAGEIRKFLTEKFYNKVLTLPQSYFDSEISGKIVNQLSRGIVSIQDFINTGTNFILPAILQSVLTVVILLHYNVLLGIFIAILFPVYIFISRYSTKKWGIKEEQKNKIEDVTRGRLQEVISNIRLVKGYTNEKEEYELVSNNLSEINRIYDKQSREFHIFDFLRNLSLNIILLGINIVVFYQTFQGQLSLGDLVLILQLVAQARRPLFGMSFILEQIQKAESGSKEFLEVLNLESNEKYEEDGIVKHIRNPKIEFKNVSFSYDHSEEVLQNISFSLNKNEIVALVGPSGAGKSTVINLILKLYEPTKGKILLNSKDYKNLNHRFIRSNIALVFQENELFSSTIRENVSYGMKAGDDQVIEALKLANAYEFVEKLPEGIHSAIGERGIKLSGGQKQRIQIARAILKDAPILILDEATSNLDAKSENEVQDALENLMKDRLTIIIAHRFSTLQNANKVVVLNNHKIEDIGTPQELAKREGIYSELLNYQIEGNKKLLKKFELY